MYRNVKKFIHHPVGQKLLMSLYSCPGCVLMFHHVKPLNKSNLRNNDHLNVSPGFFDQLLSEVNNLGFAFVSMSELSELLKRKKNVKKVAALTFDDGYLDNVTNALPILKSHNAPATIYVATGLVSGDVLPWWDLLENYIVQNEKISDCRGNMIECKTANEKESVFLQIRQSMQIMSPEDIRKFFIDRNIADDSMSEFGPKQMLSLEQIESFSKSDLITFGSHTHTHTACGKMEYEIFEKELKKSSDILRSANVDIRHFAYPYGDDVLSDKEIENILKSNGIESCVTTFPGLVTRETDRYFIPRYFVSEYDCFSLKKRLYPDYLENLKQRLRSLI